MRLIADTNVVIRVLTLDDAHHFEVASRTLATARTVVFTTVMLCEAVWTLRATYKWRTPEIAAAIRLLVDDERVECDHGLVARGLAMLDAGGDFADGVIAADGRRHADAPFATFDRQAARLLEEQGVAVTLLG